MQDSSITVMRDPEMVLNQRSGGFVFNSVASAPEEVASKSFHPLLYWAVIVATTTAGTTMADYADRSLGIGYVGGSLMLFTILMIVLGVWRFSMGSVLNARVCPAVL